MFRDTFLKIMNEYPIESKNTFAGNDLADFIRHGFPESVRENFPKYQNFIWHASAGQGRWSDAPWLAIFNPAITNTAQIGYYPVYLFTRSLNSLYLSLNQGMTVLQNSYGKKQAINILSRRAQILREKLSPQFKADFNKRPIDLEFVGSGSRLEMYEPGHVFGIKYNKENFPSDEKLISDLQSMLSLYDLAFELGGTDEFEESSPNKNNTSENDDYDLIVDEKKMGIHKSAERRSNISKRVKEIHGFTCEICGMNFENIYGELGKNYIEAHHLTPFSELPEGEIVKLSIRNDFAVVCANCHRMLHRKGSPDSFKAFKEYYLDLTK